MSHEINQLEFQKHQLVLHLSCIAVFCVKCKERQDAWTSISTDLYVTITAHYITDEFKLVAWVLPTLAMNESHTGANVTELLQSVVNEW